MVASVCCHYSSTSRRLFDFTFRNRSGSPPGEGLLVSRNPAHRWDPQMPAAYFLLPAHRDCLWKINQCFAAALCFLLADTHHINKLKLLDATSVFWLVFFPRRKPEKDGQCFIIAPFEQVHTIFSDTKGCDCALTNIVAHFQDKYLCFLHISEVMERKHRALAAAHSLYTVLLKRQPFLFTSFTHPLCPKPLRYYTYQGAISNIWLL